MWLQGNPHRRRSKGSEESKHRSSSIPLRKEHASEKHHAPPIWQAKSSSQSIGHSLFVAQVLEANQTESTPSCQYAADWWKRISSGIAALAP